jgi:signal transduction histidine kinase
VTSQKIAQRALADLSRKLMNAHEEERVRIARELHDDIGQRTAVLTMDLDRLEQNLPMTSDLRLRAQMLANHARDLARDIQRVSHRMHPAKLDYLGLPLASAGFCQELADETSVDIGFSHEGIPSDVPKDVALCLFRVLQEAVGNAVKHAHAGQITVTLRGTEGEIRLEVVDAGVGFDFADAIHGRGLGLISMRERLSLVKGEVRIESQRGAGTRVHARVPLRRPAKPSERRVTIS